MRDNYELKPYLGLFTAWTLYALGLSMAFGIRPAPLPERNCAVIRVLDGKVVR